LKVQALGNNGMEDTENRGTALNAAPCAFADGGAGMFYYERAEMGGRAGLSSLIALV